MASLRQLRSPAVITIWHRAGEGWIASSRILSSRVTDWCLTGVYRAIFHRVSLMPIQTDDSELVTLELTDATLQALDDKAVLDHRGNRAAAIRDLLDEWLTSRN